MIKKEEGEWSCLRERGEEERVRGRVVVWLGNYKSERGVRRLKFVKMERECLRRGAASCCRSCQTSKRRVAARWKAGNYDGVLLC